MTSLGRKRSLVFGVFAAAVVALGVWLVPAYAASPQAAAVIGAGARGQHAYEFIGHIDQNGPSFVSYGYLTHIQGIRTRSCLPTRSFTRRLRPASRSTGRVRCSAAP